MPFADFPEVLAVSGVSGKKDRLAVSFDDVPATKPLVPLEQSSAALVSRRNTMDGDSLCAIRIPYIHFDRAGESRLADVLSIPDRYDHRGLMPSPETTHGSQAEMVVIVVGNENEVDLRELIERDARLLHPGCDEADRMVVGGIREYLHAVDIKKDSGVVDEGKNGLHPAPCPT